MADFIIIPAIAYGFLLGIIELIFLAQDQGQMQGWIMHGLHAIPIMMVFTFVAFNISWVLGLLKMQDSLWLDIGFRVIIGIIAMVKVKAAASISGNVSGFGEGWTHVFIIGILMMGGPFIWDYALKGLVQSQLPWIK